MYTIGEFSKLTALTVKTLHHYHDKGLLTPARIDRQSGYRYYDRASVERARVIKLLRGLDLSLDEIGLILTECKDDGDALEFLERHRRSIESKVRRYQDILSALDHVVAHEREAQAMMNQETHVEEKLLPAQLVAGIRAHGRYDACGERFKRLGRAYGFALAGKPGNLVYDAEYKEEDADYESYFPIKRQKPAEGIAVHTLPETRCLCLVHKGPYDEISRTYAKLLDALHARGLVAGTPSREVYIKGPGMIFKGNPRRYLTEVQIPIADASSAP